MVKELSREERKKGAQWVIDKKQSVFLGGRNFFNGVVVSYEVIDEAKRKKRRELSYL